MSETQKAKKYFEEGYGLYCMHKYDKAIEKIDQGYRAGLKFCQRRIFIVRNADCLVPRLSQRKDLR